MITLLLKMYFITPLIFQHETIQKYFHTHMTKK